MEELTYEQVLNFVKSVIKYEIPVHKFNPCVKCRTGRKDCVKCESYDQWRKMSESNPILSYEQNAIDFIGELKSICNQARLK